LLLISTTLFGQNSKEQDFLQSCESSSNQTTFYTYRIILRSLKEDDCKIAFSRLSRLTQISLPREGIVDITPFQYFENLTGIDLSGNNIKESLPLGRLIEVQTLLLSSNKIESVEFVENLPFLKNIQLADNNISNLDSFRENGSIEILNLSGNQELNDLNSLSHLPLTSLNLSRSQLGARVFGALPQSRLSTLDLSEVGLEDVTHFSQKKFLPAIRKLLIQKNKIKNISAISDLSTLHVLNISSNPVIDLLPLASLKKLVALDVSHTSGKDLDLVISEMSLLELYAQNTNLESLDLMESMRPEARTLDLSHNKINDISKLKRFRELGHLKLNGNPITDIDLDWLYSLKNLKVFDIDIKNISSSEKRKKLLEFKAIVFERNRQ
jgi:hypothetical protein